MGTTPRPMQLHDLLMPLNHALFSEPSPMPLKGALTAYWDSVGIPRLPLMAARAETVEAIGSRARLHQGVPVTMTVKVGFLGGLGEVGRNCASIEIDGELALVDCGLMFPEEDMLGVDLVLPDFTSILDRPDDLKCIILTHGHEDHIGALVVPPQRCQRPDLRHKAHR